MNLRLQAAKPLWVFTVSTRSESALESVRVTAGSEGWIPFVAGGLRSPCRRAPPRRAGTRCIQGRAGSLAGSRLPLQLPLALSPFMSQSRLVEWLRWPRRRPTDRAEFESLAISLLSGKGEASGVALATRLLEAYAQLDEHGRSEFFDLLLTRFGADLDALRRALTDFERKPDARTTARLHDAAEPRRQELIRRMNLAPGGTLQLVRMRESC